ncbi:MAG: hypothetical protein RL141_356 [Candidatus Parcubacteria bacterium]|jgi:hypothetical protein
MVRLEEVIQLKEGEEVKALTRRHIITLFPQFLAALVLIVAPFFFLFPLFTSGPAGIMVFGVLVLVGVLVAIRGFVMWDGDLFIITNHRIIDVDQQGLFARTINEITYLNMQDPSWSKKSPIDFILGIGRVSARSSSGSLTIEARFVPRPRDLHQMITDYSQEALAAAGWIASPSVGGASKPKPPASSGSSKEVLLERVGKQLEHMDEKALERLAKTLKGQEQDIAVSKLFGDQKNALKEIKE